MIVQVVVSEHPEYRMLLIPQAWHHQGDGQANFAADFVADMHNTHLNLSIRQLAKMFWMLYNAPRQAVDLPSALTGAPAHIGLVVSLLSCVAM